MFSLLSKFYRRILAGFLLLLTEITLVSVLFLIAFSGFVYTAKYIFWDDKTQFDTYAFEAMHHFINERNNTIIMFFTSLGNYQFLIAANLLVMAYFLFVRKHRWYSIKIPAVALSSVVLMYLLKIMFNRPRPLIPLLEPALGLSFPSGHAMSSVTFYGLLIYFIWKQENMNKALRSVLIIFLVFLILAIGISRIYLRVHYASDVIAGFCVGIIWLTTAIFIIDRIQGYTRRNLTEVIEAPDDENNS